MRLAGRNIDEQRTFGYRRASIPAAMLNAAVPIGISLFLFQEAYFKFTGVHPVNGLIVIWVALVGLAAREKRWQDGINNVVLLKSIKITWGCCI
jgi:cobalt-zinc-cadmium efflux system protein